MWRRVNVVGSVFAYLTYRSSIGHSIGGNNAKSLIFHDSVTDIIDDVNFEDHCGLRLIRIHHLRKPYGKWKMLIMSKHTISVTR